MISNNFINIDTIDELLKKADVFDQDPHNQNSDTKIINTPTDSYMSFPESGNFNEEFVDEASELSIKSAQKLIELLDGTMIGKDDLISWYHKIRGNIMLIQTILNGEDE